MGGGIENRPFLTARCDREPANFLNLNLVDDIVKGKHSVKRNP